MQLRGAKCADATGEVEDAVLEMCEMWLQGISQRKITEVTQKLGAVSIGKDAVSRIAQRLDQELQGFRQRQLEHAYPYLERVMHFGFG